MSGESKRKKKRSRQKTREIPPDIEKIIDEAMRATLEQVLGQIYAASRKIRVRIKEREESREELEKVFRDVLRLDPREIGEYLSYEEYIDALASAIYFTKKAAASRPANPTAKQIIMYFRTIDAIAAMLVEMIKNARGIVLERTIQIKQAAVMREDPLEELERLETILIMLDGLRKHIKNIIDEMDT